MKKQFQFSILICIMILASIHAFANGKLPKLTLIQIDVKGLAIVPMEMGNLTRLELEKLGKYDVTDRYDIKNQIEELKINTTNCYGKLCLLEIGKALQSDFVFTGSVELINNTITISYRLIDVKGGSVIKTQIMEFLNLPEEIQSMAAITLQHMFRLGSDQALENRLTNKFAIENSINSPNNARVSLSGPRFGYAFLFGKQATRLAANLEEGGYEMNPAVFQFGYQFEWQYLNEGNYQALIEFVPMISGIDQQKVIPSFTLLQGFRNNIIGLEFAFGPVISLANYKDLYYDGKHYYDEEQAKDAGLTNVTFEKTLDSRGSLAFNSAIVFAVGKTFKSGNLNIPINLFVTVPSSNGYRIGISIGYNSKK